MARWNEEQERWTGGRYGEEQRRGDWRAEHGGEGSWRGRDWRDEDRGGSWRGEERRDDWGWRGERGTSERGPMERWSSERDREHEGGWSEREREGRGEREGRRRYGRGEYGRGRYGERGISPEAGYGLTEGPSFGAGGMYGGAGGMYAGAPGGGETYGPSIGSRGRFGGGPTRGTYGGSERWSEEDRDQGYGRGDYTRDLRRNLRGYGEEEEQGPFERMGEKVKEGFRKLTGRGPKGYKRSDERIREDVSERIARSWVNAEDVEVKVEKGEVTLTGFVESREDKRRLEDLADDVFGVEEVHNDLRLRRESTTQTLGSGQAQQTAGTQGTTGQQAGQRGQQGTTQPGRQ
jgi:hypothetical protein